VKVIPNSAVLDAERPLECECECECECGYECVVAGTLANSVCSTLGRAVDERPAVFPVPYGLGADVSLVIADRDGSDGTDGRGGRGGSGGTAGMSTTGTS
jgi:hypothetical protein